MQALNIFKKPETLLIGAAIVGPIGAVFGDWREAIIALSAVLAMGGIMRATVRCAVRNVMKPQADVYEDGVQQGYDQGWHDGRRSDRLTVVPFRMGDAQAN